MECAISKKNDCYKDCRWSIKSQKYNYCFWEYILENSDQQGMMTPVSQSEIVTLLGIRSSQASLIIKQAFLELDSILPKEFLLELLEDSENTGFEEFSFVKDIPTIL